MWGVENDLDKKWWGWSIECMNAELTRPGRKRKERPYVRSVERIVEKHEGAPGGMIEESESHEGVRVVAIDVEGRRVVRTLRGSMVDEDWAERAVLEMLKRKGRVRVRWADLSFGDGGES